jgi:hypothetical protein
MMVEELNTPKEIGLAFEVVVRSIQGIRDQLSQLKRVLGIAAVIFVSNLQPSNRRGRLEAPQPGPFDDTLVYSSWRPPSRPSRRW